MAEALDLLTLYNISVKDTPNKGKGLFAEQIIKEGIYLTLFCLYYYKIIFSIYFTYFHSHNTSLLC